MTSDRAEGKLAGTASLRRKEAAYPAAFFGGRASSDVIKTGAQISQNGTESKASFFFYGRFVNFPVTVNLRVMKCR